MSRDERGGAQVPTAVATTLAVLAVVAVLTSATLAAVTGRDETAAVTADDTATGGGAPPMPSRRPGGGATDESDDADDADDADGDGDGDGERFFPGGQVLTGDRRENANLEIPSVEAGWTFAPGFGVGFVSDEGNGSLTVDDPYLFRESWCENAAGSPRDGAWVGFAEPELAGPGDDPAREVARETAELWQQLIFEGRRDPLGFAPDIDYTDVEVSDGTPAVEARFVYEITRGRDRCTAPAAELRFLTFETGDHVAVVVLRRDVDSGGSDLRGGLTGEDADLILTSARIQQED